jgi:hypothetical protein
LNEIYVQRWTDRERRYTLTEARPPMRPAGRSFPTPGCESGGQLAVVSHGLMRQT